jgi:hypothetical protein
MQLIVMKTIDGSQMQQSPILMRYRQSYYTALVSQLQLWHIQWLVFGWSVG